MSTAQLQLIESAASVVAAMGSGAPLPGRDAETLLAALADGMPPHEAEVLVRSFQPHIRACDWLGYIARNALPLHGLSEQEREGLAPPIVVGTEVEAEADPTLRDFRRRWAEHLDWAADEAPLARHVEALVGLDVESAYEIAAAVGEVSQGPLTLPDVPARLRAALPAAPLPADRTEYPRFLHDLLRALGTAGRSGREVVRLCGYELGLLFPDDHAPGQGTYKYRQARLLLEDRLQSHPGDIDALAWLAELCLRAGDPTADRLVERVWASSEGRDPTDLARLVQFSLGHAGDYTEPSYDGSSGVSGLLGSVVGEWLDRTEPLAVALLRRAFAAGRWNADLVQTVIEFDCGVTDVPSDLMPFAGWAWGALRSSPAGYHYYREWEHALAAAEARGDGLGVTLAVPVLMAGAIRRRCDGRYAEWLESLRSHAATPGARQAAARVLAGVANFRDNLPPPARVELARLLTEFADDLAPPDEDAEADAEIFGRYDHEVDRQRPLAAACLGEDLWERLGPHTQEHVLQALYLYHSYQQADGDRRNYGLAFVALSNAILTEVERQFGLALRCDFFARSGGSKSLGDLCHSLYELHRPGLNAVARHDAGVLRAAGVRLDRVVGFADDMWELAGARNHAAHSGKIDRERAVNLHAKWFVQSRLRELLEAIMQSR